MQSWLSVGFSHIFATFSTGLFHLFSPLSPLLPSFICPPFPGTVMLLILPAVLRLGIHKLLVVSIDGILSLQNNRWSRVSDWNSLLQITHVVQWTLLLVLRLVVEIFQCLESLWLWYRHRRSVMASSFLRGVVSLLDRGGLNGWLMRCRSRGGLGGWLMRCGGRETWLLTRNNGCNGEDLFDGFCG